MARRDILPSDFGSQSDLLKKILMLELFKLGLSQSEIGKKLKMKKEGVNAFLKGIKRKE